MLYMLHRVISKDAFTEHLISLPFDVTKTQLNANLRLCFNCLQQIFRDEKHNS